MRKMEHSLFVFTNAFLWFTLETESLFVLVLAIQNASNTLLEF